MKFSKILFSVLIIFAIFASNVAIAGNANTHTPTHTTTANPGNSNSSHASNHPGTNPANITFNKGLAKAREIVASKTEFKTIANTSNPLYIWGDRNYSIQNSLQLKSIVEYSDKNNNYEYDTNEAVTTLVLQNHVSWNFFQDELNSSSVIFTLYTSSINQTGFENTQINLTQTATANNNYMKFSIVVSNWNWTSVHDRLAFIFNFGLTGAALNSDIQINSKENISNNNEANDGIFIQNNKNQTIGYLLSSTTATNGSAGKILAVKNQFQINHVNRTASIILNYPYFGNYLNQDPIIGSNGSTYTVLSQLYSILIDKQSLLTITVFLSVVSLIALFIMRRRY